MAASTFDSLAVHQHIKNAIHSNFKYNRMTPVQAASIPIFLKNKDVCVQAVTGSGKTLAFLIPLINYSLNEYEKCDMESKDKFHQKIHSIIIEPTRELAEQTLNVLTQLSDNSCVKSLLIIGGNKFKSDMRRVADDCGNIIVATPGRLARLLQESQQFHRSIRDNLNFFVLDEADLLLDMGFEQTINEILKKMPKQRRTGLFSATQTKQLEHLVRAGLRDPVKIEIKVEANSSTNQRRSNQIDESLLDKSSTKCTKNTIHSKDKSSLNIDPERLIDPAELPSTNTLDTNYGQMVTDVIISPNLTNYYTVVDSYAEKLALCVNFVASNAIRNSKFKAIIFITTCAQVNYFHNVFQFCFEEKNLPLKKGKKKQDVTSKNSVKNVKIFKLHRMLKRKRSEIFRNFSNENDASILLATDIVARGIDVKDLDWVIHFDLPNSLQDYVHRSGRSGHMIGLKGMSLLLALPHEMPYITLCKQKNISLAAYEATNLENTYSTADDLIKWMKSEARKGYSFYQEGMRALVSFVRTYSSQNILSGTLFPLIDVMSLVESFGLLKVPKMPELKGRLTKEQIFNYCQPQDEKLLAQYEKQAEKKKSDNKKDKSTSIKERVKLRGERRSKISRKITSSKLTGKRKKQLIDEIECQELAEDARMIKKVKKGKITEKEFDIHFGI